jgi:hypothetical protein
MPRVDRAELVEREPPQLEPAMHAKGEHRLDARWSQPRSRTCETAESGAHFREEGLGRLSQDQLFVQALEQPHAQAILKRLDLLADSARRHVQLLGGKLETQVPRGGLEGPERIERWQDVGHRSAV